MEMEQIFPRDPQARRLALRLMDMRRSRESAESDFTKPPVHFSAVRVVPTKLIQSPRL